VTLQGSFNTVIVDTVVNDIQVYGICPGPRPRPEHDESDRSHSGMTGGTMRRYAPALAVVAIAAAAMIGLSGCSSGGNTKPTATAGTSGAQVQLGNTINYGSFNTTADIDCSDGKSLNVGGSGNTLTVKGTCGSVNIGGADNKLTFDTISNDISVVGVNNTVTYKGGNPKVENLGSGNQVNKG
jgi:hypothetical protein